MVTGINRMLGMEYTLYSKPSKKGTVLANKIIFFWTPSSSSSQLKQQAKWLVSKYPFFGGSPLKCSVTIVMNEAIVIERKT